MNTIDDEIWALIPESYGCYISNLGRVQTPEKILVLTVRKSDGLIDVNIKMNKYILNGTNGTMSSHVKLVKKLVHRLVAETFIPNPEKLPHVIHINRNKTDNRAINLIWGVGNHYKSSKDIRQYLPDGTWIDWKSPRDIVQHFKENNIYISPDTIRRACNSKNKSLGYFFRYKNEVDDTFSIRFQYEVKRRLVGKPVIQNLPDGTINSYYDVNSASKISGININNITKACDRKGGSCSGYLWYFKEDFTYPRIFLKKNRKVTQRLVERQVKQYLGGIGSRVFQNCFVAGEELGLSPKGIANVCYNKKSYEGGFRFSFVN